MQVALLMQTQQLDKAVEVIQNFLKHKPNHVESLNHLSNVLSQLGRLEEVNNSSEHQSKIWQFDWLIAMDDDMGSVREFEMKNRLKLSN